MSQKNKVYVLGGGLDFNRMFSQNGWELTNDLFSAQMIQFTGGSDVSPSFYGEKEHKLTHTNIMRDKRERIIFNIALKYKIPMAGICRGGQFLNVMNGGELWQHVDGHVGVGSHKVVDMESGQSFVATSTHHQMMKPHKSGKVLVMANESTKKEKMGKNGQLISLLVHEGSDVEAVFYLKSQSFCFQPHPEFGGFHDLTNRYFGYIKNYLHL